MPLIIDDRYIDVDFTIDPLYTMGDNGQDPMFFGDAYEDRYGVMSPEQIDEAIEKQDADDIGLDDLVVNIFNQGKEGSCVANAWGQAHQVLQAKQLGKDRVTKLSAISLYKQIGTSAQSGANVTRGGETMASIGILPLDTPENRAKYKHVMPATGFSTRYPDNWKETAKLFRAHEMYRCKTVEGIFTANLRGFPVIVGRQGHSICYLRPTLYKGKRMMKYANSWGSWGDRGYGYDTQSQIEMSASGAWAVRSIILAI